MPLIVWMICCAGNRVPICHFTKNLLGAFWVQLIAMAGISNLSGSITDSVIKSFWKRKVEFDILTDPMNSFIRYLAHIGSRSRGETLSDSRLWIYRVQVMHWEYNSQKYEASNHWMLLPEQQAPHYHRRDKVSGKFNLLYRLSLHDLSLLNWL